MNELETYYLDGRKSFTFAPYKSLKQRFYERVLLPNENGCMFWIGDKNRYGRITRYLEKQEYIYAHRYSYELHFGRFNKELCVLHRCDNPLCVAPSHLFLGTHADNMRDCKNKNRNRCTPRYGEENHAAKLTEKQVKNIKKALENGGKVTALAEKYGVTRQSISNIKHSRTWGQI